MKCPYCGHDNENESKTCTHCHAGLHAEEVFLKDNTKVNSDIEDNTNPNGEKNPRGHKKK